MPHESKLEREDAPETARSRAHTASPVANHHAAVGAIAAALLNAVTFGALEASTDA